MKRVIDIPEHWEGCTNRHLRTCISEGIPLTEVFEDIKTDIEGLKHEHTDVSGYRWWDNAIANALSIIDHHISAEMNKEMTREEELDWLYRLKSEIYVYMPKEWLIPMNDALDSAIKSLEQESKTGHWIVDGSVDCYLDKVRCHCSECGKKKEFPADYDHIKQELSISY